MAFGGIKLGIDNPLIKDEKNWKGQNLLGQILTKVRDDLIKELEEGTFQ